MSDYLDAEKIAKRMTTATRDLHGLVDAVALAKQIKEFAADQRKNLLARYAAPLLGSHSSTAAETLARADDGYQHELQLLSKHYEHAESTLAKWSAEMCSYEASRSLLSLAKETVKELQG